LIAIVAIASCVSFLDGSVAIDCGTFHEKYSLAFCSEVLLLTIILAFLLIHFVNWIINFPKRIFKAFHERHRRKIEQTLVKVATDLIFTQYSEDEARLLDHFDLFDENVMTSVLATFAADKTNHFNKIEALGRRLANSNQTERLGKMYLAKYYDKLGNNDFSLNFLINVIKDFYHTHKEEICLKNLIFRGYMKTAEEGNFERGKTIHYDECDGILSNVQISQLISIQAKFEKNDGASKERLIKLYSTAYKLDRDNVEAISYANDIMTYMTFSDMNTELVDSFHRNPHQKIIETLADLNTCAGMTKIFSLLKKGVKKVGSGISSSNESLYCLILAAIEANLWGEAKDLIDELERAQDLKKSRRIGALKIELEKQKSGLSDEVFNIQESILKSQYVDVFRCEWCHADSPVLLEYCRNCGAIRSLKWLII
jgi:hypothetical protein